MSSVQLPTPVKRLRPTEAEEALAWEEYHAQTEKVRDQRKQATELARPALLRLVEVLKVRSGQPYKVRSLLFSMWNGKPADLSQTLNLDWQIKADLCCVLLAFGGDQFFYKELEEAITKGGQWSWFIEEANV